MHVDEDCVSRQEFESLKYDLHYWQNVTLTIIKNNIANQRGKSESDVPTFSPIAISVVSVDYYKNLDEDQDCKALQEDVNSLKDCFNTTFEEILSTISEDAANNECMYICTSFYHGSRIKHFVPFTLMCRHVDSIIRLPIFTVVSFSCHDIYI